MEDASLAVIADDVIDTLADSGTEIVFGFPGETSLPLYLAAQRQTRVRHLIARCPRCAGYMAEAYARITGKIGVCDAPGGIGSLHVAPVLLEAQNSSTPLMFLFSGAARSSQGRWVTGGCDQQSVFAPLSKASYRFEMAQDLTGRLAALLNLAQSPRRGPVCAEIPADVLVEPSVSRAMAFSPPAGAGCPRPESMAAVTQHITTARQVVLVVGGGVHGAGVEQLRQLIAATDLPIATTLNGKGAIDERLPNAIGVTGAKGSTTANCFVHDADVIVAIGTKLGDKSTDRFRWPRPGQQLIHVDSDPAELSRYGHPSVPVLSDAATFCDDLRTRLAGYRYRGPRFVESSGAWQRGLTDALCRRLSDELDDDSIVVADASVASGWAGAVLQLRGARQRLLTPRGSGSIGYALPAALGAQCARPDARVFALGGDGGFAMSVHELETAVRLRLPIVFFLLNNARLGLIDKHAELLNNGQPVSAEFQPIDWPATATAFGWQSWQVRDDDELNAVWDKAVTSGMPTLVECIISKDEVAPDFLLASDHDSEGLT